MHAVVLAVLSSGLVAADVPTPEEATVDDRKELQGDWGVVAVHIDGDDRTNSFCRLVWSYQEDRLIELQGIVVCDKGTFNLDHSGHPTEIVIHFDDSDRTYRGIYRVHGPWMDLAYVSDGDGPLPTKFISEKGSNVILMTLHRLKK